jgi:hypothetical protein
MFLPYCMTFSVVFREIIRGNKFQCFPISKMSVPQASLNYLRNKRVKQTGYLPLDRITQILLNNSYITLIRDAAKQSWKTSHAFEKNSCRKKSATTQQFRNRMGIKSTSPDTSEITMPALLGENCYLLIPKHIWKQIYFYAPIYTLYKNTILTLPNHLSWNAIQNVCKSLELSCWMNLASRGDHVSNHATSPTQMGEG